MDIIPVTTVETYQSALFLLNLCFTFITGLFQESSTVYQVNAYIYEKKLLRYICMDKYVDNCGSASGHECHLLLYVRDIFD